ncbi:T-cell-specific surface glycoprotein CD28-like [Hemicordylus capensis]|uniref:T-cell-specific surface glycoprotein CD28-like n=1 Tax=Hemicordylus capensis TaxID=884348 RepID=UPI0023049BCA|nr:T-cell-specific surface glycoprotein CD28-like [Hemicordylus capensis]
MKDEHYLRRMKLEMLTASVLNPSILLLCFYFQPLYGAGHCSSSPSCRDSCKDYLPASNDQVNDEFPKETFHFNYSLPNSTKSFHMKLFKGKSKQEFCALYKGKDSRVVMNHTEFCDPVFSDSEVSFVLRNLKSSHSDTYICCLEILLPVYHCCKATESHLYIQEPSETCLVSKFTSWLLIGLSIFSILACICCLLSCCLRNTICRHASHSSRDYSNEYMSMAAVKHN